jgi:hypothetical protein
MEALDGNALAGALYAAFGHEMTMADGTCATCGHTNLLATFRVYLRAPGAVARCPVCGEVGLVLVQSHGVACVDARGLSNLSTAREE